MDRRAFFQRTAQKAGETAVKELQAQVSRRAAHWIRPPYALHELDFLLTCTRCGDCIAACPHQVIFSLPARLGAQVAGTPALDLLNKGCHLCADWPCVAACEPAALKCPETRTEDTEAGEPARTSPPLPRLAMARIDPTICLPYLGPECGACASSCPVPGAMIWEAEKPRIDPETCTGCGMCREACIAAPKAVEIRSLHWRSA